MGYKLNIGGKGSEALKKRQDKQREAEEEEFRNTYSEEDIKRIEQNKARNKGAADGSNGTPDSEMLSSEYRSDYISGYKNGSWWRFRMRDRDKYSSRHLKIMVEYLYHRWYEDEEEEKYIPPVDQIISDYIFDCLYLPRYPHEPIMWMA